MAFICGDCHKKIDGTDGSMVHFSGSYGPCESCRQTRSCHDCHCSWPQPKLKKTDLVPPPITEFKVQTGRYKGSYKTRWVFESETQAYMFYNGINTWDGYKKRLLKNGKVIERFIS